MLCCVDTFCQMDLCCLRELNIHSKTGQTRACTSVPPDCQSHVISSSVLLLISLLYVSLNRLHSALLSCLGRIQAHPQSCFGRHIGRRKETVPINWRRPHSTGCSLDTGFKALQTFYCRQPSFSGCRRQDLERAAGQSGRNDVTTDFPAPFEDISVSAFFLIALQWTWQ